MFQISSTVIFHFFFVGILSLVFTACSQGLNLEKWQSQKQEQMKNSAHWKENLEKGLKTYTELIPPQELEHYGFKNSEELNHLNLGEPLAILPLGADQVDTTHSIWNVPVKSDSSTRVMLMIQPKSQTTGEWEVIGIGSSGIAARLDELHSQIPETQNAPLTRSYTLKTDYLIAGNIAYPLFPIGSTPLTLDDLKMKNIQSQNITPQVQP